jgi:hypothetical protein
MMPKLFGRHIARRTHDGARVRYGAGFLRGRRSVHSRETKVENLDPAVARQQDIIRFEIPMRDAGIVGRRQTIGDLRHYLHRLALREMGVVERFALHDLGHHVVVANIKNTQNIGMIQSGHRAGFFFESMAARRVMRNIRGQHLHGDIAVQTRIASAVNLAHTSGADRSDNLVRTQARGTGERHVISQSLAAWHLIQ